MGAVRVWAGWGNKGGHVRCGSVQAAGPITGVRAKLDAAMLADDRRPDYRVAGEVGYGSVGGRQAGRLQGC